jgi:uncharacterized protein (TIGR02996 family)
MRDPLSLSLLAAVAEAPDDLAVRLVYADRMEEIGNVDRAEFIRVQIRLGGLGTPTCERTDIALLEWGKMTPRCRCAVCKLKRREYQCSCRHIGVWDWHTTPDHAHLIRINDWRNGFVEQVTMTHQEWQTAGPSLVSVNPIRHLVLSVTSGGPTFPPGSVWQGDPKRAAVEWLRWARQQAGFELLAR